MIERESRDSIEIVRIDTDNLNALISEQLRDSLTAIIENGTHKMIVDLGAVKYVDSTGFGSLLAITRSAKSNYCVIKFCNINPEVMKVLKMLHLHTVFNIHTDITACIEDFS